MNKTTKQFLYWSPRVICILFALFTTIFALDVFGEVSNFWRTLLALLMHLIPTGIIVCTLIISWRWERTGGVIFIALTIVYIVFGWGGFPLSVYFVMCGPMVLMSVLFFINWKYKAELQTK